MVTITTWPHACPSCACMGPPAWMLSLLHAHILYPPSPRSGFLIRLAPSGSLQSLRCSQREEPLQNLPPLSWALRCSVLSSPMWLKSSSDLSTLSLWVVTHFRFGLTVCGQGGKWGTSQWSGLCLPPTGPHENEAVHTPQRFALPTAGWGHLPVFLLGKGSSSALSLNLSTQPSPLSTAHA